jgi:hypothetical protein
LANEFGPAHSVGVPVVANHFADVLGVLPLGEQPHGLQVDDALREVASAALFNLRGNAFEN